MSMKPVAVVTLFGLSVLAWETLRAAEDPSKGAPAAAAADPLAKLGWIAGSWAGTQGPIRSEEHWTPPRGGTMLGVARMIDGERTVFFEYLRIEKRADGIYYVANPAGRGETAFQLVSEEARKAVFENPRHDFPTKITYWADGDAVLHARIEGRKDGQTSSEEFHWKAESGGWGR